MRDNFIKRFAVIFSVLVLLQECTARGVHYQDELDYLDKNFLYEYEKDYAASKSKLPSTDVATFEQPQNGKRGLGLALILVSGASAGIDIYKQEAGCKDAAPNLEGNVRTANTLQNQAIAKKNAINIAWNPIVDKEARFQALGSQMTILREQVAKLDSLQFDIVKLLDQDIFTKIDLTKRELENLIAANNDTAYGDPSLFLANFFATPGAYALTLSLKLLPLAVWLGSKTIFPIIGKQISAAVGRQWATGNPNAVSKMYRHLETKGLFPNTRLKFKTWVAKSPTLTKIRTKFTFSKLNAERLASVKSGIVRAGSAVVVVLFIAYEVYNTWKFVDDCKKKEAESAQMVADLRENLVNMTKIETNMTLLLNEVTDNFGLMQSNLMEETFGNFVKDVRELAINAQTQTTALETAATDLNTFLDQINSTKVNGVINFEKTGTLMELLLKSFNNVNYKLECYRKKVLIISQITADCGIGLGNYDTLWTKAKSLEGKTLENCIVNQTYLSQSEVSGVIKGFMEVQKKSTICLRNNPTKKQLVCSNWYNDMTDANNVINVGDLELADVQYFITQCEPGPVTDARIPSICNDKANNKSSAVSVARLSRLNQAQVIAAYDACKLSAAQKLAICNSKGSGYLLAKIQNDYYYYPKAEVLATYDTCVFTPTPNDLKGICDLVLYQIPIVHPLFDQYKSKYGGTAGVQGIIDSSCPLASGKRDEKNKRVAATWGNKEESKESVEDILIDMLEEDVLKRERNH